MIAITSCARATGRLSFESEIREVARRALRRYVDSCEIVHSFGLAGSSAGAIDPSGAKIMAGKVSARVRTRRFTLPVNSGGTGSGFGDSRLGKDGAEVRDLVGRWYLFSRFVGLGGRGT